MRKRLPADFRRSSHLPHQQARHLVSVTHHPPYMYFTLLPGHVVELSCLRMRASADCRLLWRPCCSLQTLELFGCFNVTARAIAGVATHCKSLLTLNLGQCWKVNTKSMSIPSPRTKNETMEYRLFGEAMPDLKGFEQKPHLTVVLPSLG